MPDRTLTDPPSYWQSDEGLEVSQKALDLVIEIAGAIPGVGVRVSLTPLPPFEHDGMLIVEFAKYDAEPEDDE